MKVILSHPTGNEFVRAAASSLFEANILHEFNTTIATFHGSLLDKLGVYPPLSDIRRRRFDNRLKPFTKLYPWREVGRHLAPKIGLSSLNRHEIGYFSCDAVYRSLDKSVASNLHRAFTKGAKGVYSYEDGSYNTFEVAKELGLKCFYDLPIGYWRAAKILLESERDRWPEWANTIAHFENSPEKLARKDEEIRLAEVIIVASRFTANTLKEYPGQLPPIEIIPYAFPPVCQNRKFSRPLANGPLKLLFVGGLSQRKGIADLFAATEALGKHVVLTVVGYKASDDCPALNAALSKHRWIPSLPHADILKIMQEHDVLVFPSLFEGFGLVITEAMSQGTPVITTDRTAGPDLISHGKNGWLVEAASARAIQEAIEVLLERPELITSNGLEAMITAERRPWKKYEQELASVINKHLINNG